MGPWNRERIRYGSDGKESACNAGDLDAEDPLEKRIATHSSDSCLENSMHRGAWQATYSPWSSTESDTTERLTLQGDWNKD